MVYPKGAKFVFGVELELLLIPKPPLEVQTWEDFTCQLSKLLSEASIKNEIPGDAKPKWKCWRIVEESSVHAHREPGQWGVELVSPLCYTRQTSNWKVVQEALWNCLRKHFIIVESEHCSTHVNISLKKGAGWKLRRVKHLVKAILYFERCIDSLMPAHRLQNRWCKSNRYNSEFRALNTAQVFERIDGVSRPQLAGLLSPERNHRWNFRHLIESDDLTDSDDLSESDKPQNSRIEFRQPPGSLTFEQATFWIQFTIAFVSGALTAELKADHTGTLGGLSRLIEEGCNYNWPGDYMLFEKFIKDKHQLEEVRPEEYEAYRASLSDVDITTIHADTRKEMAKNKQLLAALREVPGSRSAKGDEEEEEEEEEEEDEAEEDE